MKKPIFIVICIGFLTLSGCYVPEKFVATLDIHPDKSSTYRYEGTMANFLAVIGLTGGGKLSNADEATLKKEVVNLSKEPRVKKVSYKGDGRYDFSILEEHKLGDKYSAEALVKVTSDTKGLMIISSNKVDANDLLQLKEAGIKLDGKLLVNLPNNVDVISHNATTSPSFFGFIGGYSWTIGKGVPTQAPQMVLRFK